MKAHILLDGTWGGRRADGRSLACICMLEFGVHAEARWEPCYAGSYRATIDPVAIIFELVVNFGRDEDAVAAATDELEQHPSVEARGMQLRYATLLGAAPIR